MTLLAPGSRRSAPSSTAPGASGARRPSLSLAPSVASADSSARVLGLVGGAVAAVLLALAVIVQRVALPLLPGGPADLVTVAVITLGLAFGPTVGCSYGFGAGLLADLLSDHTLGRLAAVLCVLGYLAGLVPAGWSRRLRFGVPIVAAGCILVPLLFALTGAFVGDTRASGSLLLARCEAGFAYGLLFSLVVLPLLPRLVASRRFSPSAGRGLRRRRAL